MTNFVFDKNNFFDECNSYGIGKLYYNYEKYAIITEFSVYGYDMNSFLVLESSFYILDENSNELNFTNSIHSKNIWIILFETKKMHFEKYHPDIVRMEFKNNIQNLKKRLNHYTTYIQFDDVKFYSHEFNRNIGFYGKNVNVRKVLDTLILTTERKTKMLYIKTLEEFLYGYTKK